MTDGPNHNVFDGEVLDSSSNDPRFRVPFFEAPTLVISDTRVGKELLRLNVVDGKLDATFDPDDLTEAAKIFVNECRKVANE